MKIVPLIEIEKQSFTTMIDDSFYEFEVKECNGSMGITLSKNGVQLTSNRRALPRQPLIPFQKGQIANFIFITENEQIPYYTEFESTTRLIYLNEDEMKEYWSKYGTSDTQVRVRDRW